MHRKDKSTSILLVCPEFPLPSNHGGRVDVILSLKKLVDHFNSVDILYVDWDEANNDQLDALKKISNGNVFLVRRTKSIFNFFSFLPFQLSSRNGLAKFSSELNYDVVFVHQDYCALFFDNLLAKNSQCRILRRHNLESKYFKSLSNTQHFFNLRFWYYFTEYIKFIFFEKFYSKRLSYNLILFISQDEYFESNFINKLWVPPSLTLDSFSPPTDTTFRVCFVGSLFMDNNLEGLLWYLDRVHPLIIKDCSEYKLLIAGNPRDNDVSFLSSYENIELYLSPSDNELNNIYSSCSVFISPMFNGAGVKLKTVNAIVNGLSVVGTDIGCQGCGLVNNKHAYIANDEYVFSSSVLKLLKDENLRISMINNAQQHIAQKFNVDYEDIFSNCFVDFK